jgi:hypothetical protein
VTQTPDDQQPKDEAQAQEAEAPGRTRKERVLHTRVPAVLEDELKRLATALRMPVSNVVRAILEDAVEAVEVVGARAEGELQGIAHRIHEQRESLRRAVQGPPAAPKAATPAAPSADPLAGVIGFQRLRLVSPSKCAICGTALARGDVGYRAVRDDDRPKVMLCSTCTPVTDEP